jgi:thiosulfate/3-mercaptopyruvate sulfurtransferase
MKKLARVLAALAALLSFATVEAATPLVDAAWVKANVGKPGVVFLDARGDPALYGAGHIPGAVPTDYVRDGWRVVRDGVPGMLPKTAALEKLIGGLGIGNGSHVVIAAHGADATEMGVATRIYWTFKVAGHDDVSVLDGGMRAYLADRTNPVETEAATPSPRPFKVTLRAELLATADDVKKALANGDASLIDHRPRQQFTGDSKSAGAARAGTIPGAANVPAIAMTEPGGGVFKSAEALKALYDRAGARTGGDAIAFCNTGHWASIGWFVSHELLGNKKARMYDGSIADWSRDANNPMQPGMAPK